MRREKGQVYVRFVCFQLVAGQRNRLGLFQALDEARDSPIAPNWALAEVANIYDWFEKNLPTPDRFGGGQTGLSWFKSEATDHVQQMHRLKLALEECGVHVEVVTTRDPGALIYQDEFQIVAASGHRRF